jgi:hypothetical protein
MLGCQLSNLRGQNLALLKRGPIGLFEMGHGHEMLHAYPHTTWVFLEGRGSSHQIHPIVYEALALVHRRE